MTRDAATGVAAPRGRDGRVPRCVTRARIWVAVLALVCLSLAAVGPALAARNVILMVSDGTGFNTWKAAAMWQGTVGNDFHDAEGWVKLAVSVHSLRRVQDSSVSPEYDLVQVPSLVYDTVKAWDPTPVEGGVDGYPFYFAGNRWLRGTAPDSASTMTAMVTGQKTYAGSVNCDGHGQPIADTAAAIAHARGKRVGIVTSVPFAHATPAAAAGAHRQSRYDYCEIALEMLTAPYPDLIAGCGNPDFDNNGLPIDDERAKQYTYVCSRSVWDFLNGRGGLEAGRPVREPGPELAAEQIAALDRWTLLQSKQQIEARLRDRAPDKLLIVPQVGQIRLNAETPHAVSFGGTLQQMRGSRADPRHTSPGYDPLTPNVPTLETLTRVALEALADDDDGFFLVVEGGAVDWAMHSNQLGRAIEELIDFKRSIRAVVDWVTDHGGWSETLLIVTSDHDLMLWGPEADSIPFDPLVDNGAGRLPSHQWLSDHHSNALVPLFARGSGADSLVPLARGTDPFRGRFIDNTDIFTVIRSELAPAPARRR